MGQGLDVVDHGRVGRVHRRVEPVHIWRQDARHGQLALHDLQQPGLLAVEVLVGAQDDGHALGACPAGGHHLRAGAAQPLGLVGVPALRGEDHLPGADGVGGDERALDHAVRVAAEQRPVLVGARLSLRAVAHQVHRRVGPGLGDRRPLPTRREPGAAAPTQPRALDLGDHVGRFPLPRRREPRAAAAVQVLRQRHDRGLGEQGDAHGASEAGTSPQPLSRPGRGNVALQIEHAGAHGPGRHDGHRRYAATGHPGAVSCAYARGGAPGRGSAPPDRRPGRRTAGGGASAPPDRRPGAVSCAYARIRTRSPAGAPAGRRVGTSRQTSGCSLVRIRPHPHPVAGGAGRAGGGAGGGRRGRRRASARQHHRLVRRQRERAVRGGPFALARRGKATVHSPSGTARLPAASPQFAATRTPPRW